MTSPAALGRMNAEAVLRRLYGGGLASISALAAGTALTRPSIRRALEDLAALGLVGSTEPVPRAIGRPAALYGFRPGLGVVLGVDVGAHSVRARVDDLEGPRRPDTEVRELPPGADGLLEHRTPVNIARVDALTPAADVRRRLMVLDETITAVLDAAGLVEDDVWAVCAATPGVVDHAGNIAHCAVIRGGSWTGDVLSAHLANRFPPSCAVAVDNDANLAALADHRRAMGSGPAPFPGVHEMVSVQAGRRLGFGVIRGGAVHRGANGQTGEVANLAGTAWARAHAWLARHDTSDLPELFAAAERGEPAAATERYELAVQLGTGLAELVYTLDPELIVLGGALARAGKTILTSVAEQLATACRDSILPPLQLSELGSDATVLGAAEHARALAESRLLAAVADRNLLTTPVPEARPDRLPPPAPTGQAR